ncbi:uncharacterized protein OCT59_011111 [Rhizophagus irregularis]|uniref:Uncharacterized protein n=2 Tax=Rhizophagus irregularis TaxID=588596 RepID=U9USY2_RHIID|nr:hypothetical protein GLOIN_2v1791407 [Rhizophagus irregularis DAOM 181602=DAOM 197198]EXX57911.1 hypothetical protein RirG_202830 [Rhizophagus irregularis DAOM 197198w]UZO19840.1 hypothetical protein OCT59_011111 [Rhizophagus irregularis]POG57718.1 hypothetical protein GLOIN_2v1791407 [Rhizophagus irregularis DAOM 181602=DAOM 197198]CAG8621837.1 6058_t:CDS:1 [Rhizophagus irregularis]GBC23491.1 hypothetical protein GLOIN_2v1791407 [Rhizophagus irregularis DAOM 181602=DAOM 197198]|eukprot:XP_025164584.1 hypothetical protein GLOIN_2v1791407 [Rhizophagus irregularis DAOM 181602=DAOM 197198]
MFVINSDIKHIINTRLQDLFTTSLKKRREQDYITLTSRFTSVSKTTTLSHITTYHDNQDIIIFGSIFCVIISLISLITFLIICMLRHKSISCSILSLRGGKRNPITNDSFSNQQHKNANTSLNPINVDSNCNLQEYKPKLKPLLLVIKHQDYLNKKEERRISYRQRFDTYQQENVRTTLRENNFQVENNKRNVRVRFNEVVKVIDNKSRLKIRRFERNIDKI